MKDTVISYGVCADNVDTWGVGRIRIIIDDEYFPAIRTSLNASEYIQKLDSENEKSNGDKAYIPWEPSIGGRVPDPYVVEPFLPKHLNLVPKVGESVKIMNYVLGDGSPQREYVGPHISNYDKLNFDSAENGRTFTSKNKTAYPQKNNIRTDGIVPDPTDISVMGRVNSDITLPDNSVVVRAGHQDLTNKKKGRGAMIQTSHYKSRKKLITQTTKTPETQVVAINYIAEFRTTVYEKTTDNPLYLQTNVSFYKVPDLDTHNYSPSKDYYTELFPENREALPEYSFTVSSATTGKTTTFLKTFFKNFDNGYALDALYAPSANPAVLIHGDIVDKRAPKNGEAIENVFNVGLYQLRPWPGQSSDEAVAIADELTPVNDSKNNLRPKKKAPTAKVITTKEEIAVDDTSLDENIIVNGADKHFFISWNDPKTLEGKMGKYCFSQEEIYKTLQKNTQPMVRGDELTKLLLELIDLILKHGHMVGVDAVGSLNKGAVDKIDEIMKKFILSSQPTPNLTGGPSILNQYLRLN